jgi:hypothetical protein
MKRRREIRELVVNIYAGKERGIKLVGQDK